MPVDIDRPVKVMLIDDNIIDLKINSKIIRLSGLVDEIISCQSGEEGLNYFKRHIQEPEKFPHLILLDIQMPEMNGFEFMENYKRFPASWKEHCMIAMLSSTLDFGDIRKAEADPYVLKLMKKPMFPEEFKTIFTLNFNVQ